MPKPPPETIKKTYLDSITERITERHRQFCPELAAALDAGYRVKGIVWTNAGFCSHESQTMLQFNKTFILEGDDPNTELEIDSNLPTLIAPTSGPCPTDSEQESDENSKPKNLAQLELELPRHLDSTADLNSLHHPKVDGRPWFPYTQEHFMIELKMSPCARLLYNWVLIKAPAGCAFVVDLLDFQAVTAEHQRGKPYSMRHIRRAVSQLESLQLIVVKSERVKMVARHPGAVVNSKPKSNSRTLMSSSRTLMSSPQTLMSAPNAETTQQQEPQLSTDLYRSFYRSAAEDTAAAREKNEERNAAEKSAAQPENRVRETRQEIDLGIKSEISHPDRSSAAASPREERDKRDAVDDAGIELSSQLCYQLMNHSGEQVKAAVNHYRQAKRKGVKVEKPAAWLISCLREQWWLESNSVQEAKYAESKPWIDWAIKERLILSSTVDPQITGDSSGSVYVLGQVTGNKALPWQDVAALYPIPIA